MHRENNERMGLLSYIKGNKKGREAHSLEREAMQDPFLADALDGYSNIEDPELDARLRRMEKKIEQYDLREKYIPDDIVAASAMERPHVPAMAMYDMHEVRDAVVQPSGQNHSNRPEKTRRGYMFWISAAAVMIFVCTISYQLGLINGKKQVGMIAQKATTIEETEVNLYEFVPDCSTQVASAVQDRVGEIERKMQNESSAIEVENIPHPSIGYKAFYEYIYDKLGLSINPGMNQINGMIVLCFSIDETGRPNDFVIVETTSPQISERVICIIKDGCKWTNAGRISSFTIIY